MILLLSCIGGPRVTPYSPPTTGAVSDEFLQKGELELRTEGGYIEPLVRASGKPYAYMNQPYGPRWVHGAGLGLTERVDLRLDAGPRWQGPGYGGEVGVLLYQRERLDLGATAGTWLTIAQDIYTSPEGPLGGQISYAYGYWSWAPSLGHRGTWRMDEFFHLHWRVRGSRAFTFGWYGLSVEEREQQWWLEHAASLSLGPETGWVRVGVGVSQLTTVRAPAWLPGVNLGLTFRVPPEDQR